MSDKLKVLCFHPALAPYRLDYFNLLAQRVDLTVVFMERNVHVQKFNQEELLSKAHFKYEYLTSGINVFGRCVRTGIVRKVNEKKPDVVIGYDASPIMLGLVVYKMLTNASFKLYTSTDDRAEQIESRQGIRKAVRDFVFGHMDGIIVTTEDAASAVRRVVKLSNDCRLPVVPIVHDTQEIRRNEARVLAEGNKWRKTNVPEGCKMLLFVGRLVPIKNLHWLLNQFAKLSSNHKIKLVLVGDGEEKESLESEALSHGIAERVLFAGRYEGDALYAIMSAADALVLCSHSETYGAVVAEAMQWGTPCVVGDHCGCKALINEGINGSVFKFDDVTEFQSSLDLVMGIPKGRASILPIELSNAVNELAQVMEKDLKV